VVGGVDGHDAETPSGGVHEGATNRHESAPGGTLRGGPGRDPGAQCGRPGHGPDFE
jgi:hypothetical protein